MAVQLQPGHYVIANKFFLNQGLVLDLFNSNPIPGAAIVTYPQQNTPNQKWNVVEQAPGQYTFQAFSPVSDVFVPVELAGISLQGTPNQKTAFMAISPGTPNEFQIVTTSSGLAWEAGQLGFDQVVTLQDSDATNERQIWIMEQLD